MAKRRSPSATGLVGLVAPLLQALRRRKRRRSQIRARCRFMGETSQFRGWFNLMGGVEGAALRKKTQPSPNIAKLSS
jgi:hypothetical protein